MVCACHVRCVWLCWVVLEGVGVPVWVEGFCAAVESGQTLKAAREMFGVSEVAYSRLRSRDRAFAARVDGLRDRVRSMSGQGGEVRSFGGFVEKYFGMTHMPHQLRIADELESLQPRSVTMVLCWPQAGKTSTIENYMVRQLALEPNHRFRVVSEAQNLSRRIVQACQRRFTDTGLYPEFIGRYGPFFQAGQARGGRPWGADEFTVYGASGVERDRSVVASSWRSSLYGSRIDTLIIDDVQSQNNINDAAEILKIVQGTLFSREIEMRTLIVGTRIAAGDFYDRILDAGLVTKLVQIPVSGGMGADAGEPTCPEFWNRNVFHDGKGVCCPRRLRTCPADGSKVTPREYMELLRFQTSEEIWEAAYMQDPQVAGVYPFAGAIDNCLDRSRSVGCAA